MAELPIPNKVKKFWDVWQLRGCIMLSLFLQAFLVSFASLRRRSKSSWLVFFIWSAYLLADWAAAVAIGLITQGQTDLCESDGNNDDLYAFWASFLLLHLGGPDGITSFALEDNEFWLRHLLGLVLQVLGAAYSIYLTLPNNKLWLPTLLVFIVGVAKYAERTCALYLASSDHFGATSLPKPNPGRDFEAEDSSLSSSTVQLSMVEAKENISCGDDEIILRGVTSSDEIKLMQVAYKLHDSFKGLIVGFGLSPECQESSRRAFLKANHTGAFRVIEHELSILYEVLHTKAVVVRRKIGYISRFLGLCFVIGAFIFFCFFAEKNGFETFDIGLTYALLIGAIVLDSMSIVHDQLISSDWTLGPLKEKWSKYIPSVILKRRRWSEMVLQYDLISYCLDDRRMYSWLYNFINAWGVLDNIKVFLFYYSEKVSEDVKASIFSDMKTLSETMFSLPKEENMEAESSDHGRFNLRRYYTNRVVESEFMNRIDQFNSLIMEQAYLPKLLTYHLATEIYCTCSSTSDDQEVKRVLKLLSRYLFYLMVTQPTMLSPNLGNWEETFKETVAEVKIFFDQCKITNRSEACEKIKEKYFSGTTPSRYHHGEEANQEEKKILVSEACVLASKLLSGEEGLEKLRDELMALLFKGAMNCEPMIHAQRLGKGGELLTFVWFLSYHLGFGGQDKKIG